MSGWMVLDAEQHDDLGLPLARGPFDTLDDARDAIEGALAGPAPTSDIASRAAAISKGDVASDRGRAKGRPSASTPGPEPGVARPPEPPPIEVRSYRSGDGDRLRALWASCDMASVGDDDEALGTMNRRNPGMMLVALQGTEIVASALGGWDGRRGWIYHVAVTKQHRRKGLARDLVQRLEAKYLELGAPKVNVMVREANTGAAAFWRSMGYAVHDSHQFGKELER